MDLELTKEEQMKIYAYFIGVNFQLGVPYLSPLPTDVRGSQDTSSSFDVYECPKDGRIKWWDFGGGGMGGDAWDFIQAMNPRVKNLKDAKKFYERRIKHTRHFPDTELKQSTLNRSSGARQNLEPVIHDIKDINDREWDYWNDLYIDPYWLMQNKRVAVLEGIDWGDGRLVHRSKPDDPIFVYDLSKAGDYSSWKAYRPLAKEFGEPEKKWKSWNLTPIPSENFYILPESGDVLLYTSGRKDGFMLSDYNFNGNQFPMAIDNPVAEGSWRKILPHIPELKQRFKYICVLFDGDKAGLKASEDFCSDGNLINLTPHFQYPEGLKDLTEIIESTYDFDYLDGLFTNCLQNIGLYDTFYRLQQRQAS